MKKLMTLFCTLFLCVVMYGEQYVVKYTVKGTGSTSHCTRILELKSGTAEEAKEKLVKQGTVSQKNFDKITIIEIKKK